MLLRSLGRRSEAGPGIVHERCQTMKKGQGRQSRVKWKKQHGFRAKPNSHKGRKHKRKPGGKGNRRGRVAR